MNGFRGQGRSVLEGSLFRFLFLIPLLTITIGAAGAQSVVLLEVSTHCFYVRWSHPGPEWK